LGQTDTLILDILDSVGNLVRRYTNKDSMYKIPDVNIPLYWIRPQQVLSADTGSHRFLWDMHYTPLNVPPSYPISAITGETAPTPTSPWVMPGKYSVKLSVGKPATNSFEWTITESFQVIMDPRVKTSMSDLKNQFDYSMLFYKANKKTIELLNNANSLQTQLKSITGKIAKGSNDSLSDKIDTCYFKLGWLNHLITGSIPTGRASLNDEIQELFGILQGADVPPTAQCIVECTVINDRMSNILNYWDLIQKMLEDLNKNLTLAKLPQIHWVSVSNEGK
jgi:hypothetical protein